MKCKNSLIREKFTTRLWDWAIFSSSPASFFSNAILLLAILMCYLIAFEWMVAYFFCLKTCSDFPIVIFSNLGFEICMCSSYMHFVCPTSSWGSHEAAEKTLGLECHVVPLLFILSPTTEMCCTKITEDYFLLNYNECAWHCDILVL